MASAEGDFAVAPYNFEPEYSEGGESYDSRSTEDSDDSDEEVLGRLISLEWCKCTNCATTTLNQPRECLCCIEIPEASALADFNSEVVKCIVEHDDFGAVCLCRAVLKTSLVRIKHLVQGMDHFNNVLSAELPNEYVLNSCQFFSSSVAVIIFFSIL
ncbi:hypothetical protein OS493_001298 [Desmophyllum pertusum]|uniref:Uncharacterized protein n=1 Tax=Desmophyllum pertusum TaxID=174260 RepID=A0A9X0D5T6_9CNID|nr:hypothetical protein OS493_001298 [Desmophyllum pertusum]